MVKQPSAVSMVKGQGDEKSEAPQTSQPASARPLSPGWYPDPGGRPGMLYWDGREWRTAPPPRPSPPPLPAPLPIVAAPPVPAVSRPTMLWWGLGIAVVLVAVGSMMYAWSSADRSSSPTATTSAGTPDAAVTSVPTSDEIPFSPTPAAPPPPVAVIVGTCDEGGTCGVKQRNAPYTDAPRLYPNDLRDGMTVTLLCQVSGDVRSSAGHGASSVWFRLDNGAYVNSVYVNAPPSGIPLC